MAENLSEAEQYQKDVTDALASVSEPTTVAELPERLFIERHEDVYYVFRHKQGATQTEYTRATPTAPLDGNALALKIYDALAANDDINTWHRDALLLMVAKIVNDYIATTPAQPETPVAQLPDVEDCPDFTLPASFTFDPHDIEEQAEIERRPVEHRATCKRCSGETPVADAREPEDTTIVEILGPDGRVHYRRPWNDRDVQEAFNTVGYSVRKALSSTPDQPEPNEDVSGDFYK